MQVLCLKNLGKVKIGDRLDVVPCPKEYSHLMFEDGVWVEKQGEYHRLFQREFEIISGEFPDSLSGEGITFVVRKLVSEFNYTKAQEILFSMTDNLEAITKILRGDACLKGMDTEYLEEEDLVYKDFLGKLKSMIFHYGANEYIPYAVVTDYGSIDKFHQMDLTVVESKLGLRASFYAKNNSDIVARAKYWDKSVNVIFKKVDFPFFNDNCSAQSSVDGWAIFYKNRSLQITGFTAVMQEEGDYEAKADIPSPYLQEEIEDDEIEEEYNDLKEKILEKNQGKFLDIKVYDEILSVPLYPFFLWLAPSYSALHSKIEIYQSIYGTPVSPSGMKLNGDSGYHNDWIIGAGLPLSRFYDIQDDVSSGLNSEIKRITGLLLGRSTDFQVLNLKKGENDILFLKEGYSNGETIVYSREEDLERVLDGIEENSIVITESGSEVAHIVSNASELDFTLLKIEGFSQNNMHFGNPIYLADLVSCRLRKFCDKGIILNSLNSGGKAGNLAKLKKIGFPVLDGIYLEEKPEFFDVHQKLIFRSAGEGSGVLASGIFKSVVTDSEFNEVFDEVWDSYSSPVALKYMEKVGEVKPAVLIQPYIDADCSAVVKYDGELKSAFCEGGCEKIVGGVSADGEVPEEVLTLFFKIQEVLGENIECEFICKNDKWFVVQAI